MNVHTVPVGVTSDNSVLMSGFLRGLDPYIIVNVRVGTAGCHAKNWSKDI